MKTVTGEYKPVSGQGAKQCYGFWISRFTLFFAFFLDFNQTLLAASQIVDVGSLTDKKVIELKGPWDYFWATWLEPGDHRPASVQHMAGRVWTPGDKPTFRRGQGYATYRLELKNIQHRMDGYSLALRSGSAALKMIVYPKNNPHKIFTATAGRIGSHANEEIPQLRSASLRFFPEAGESEWIVLIQMSNFHYGRGGLWNVPLLGVGGAADARLNADREFLIFCLGMIMVIGVYNIVLFVRRPVDKPTLMLAIFCVVVSLRSIATDNLIAWYFPKLDVRVYEWKYLVEYITMVVGPLSCISFIHLSFVPSSFPRFYRLVVNISLLAGLAILIANPYYCSLILPQLQIATLLQVIFGLSVLVRAVIQKREESWLSAAGGITLSACVIYDILITFDVFSQPYMTSLGMSAFVFMQSQVVAHRFVKAFGIAEHLSQKLKDEVELQTLELRSILENIPQGVFIMLADQTIQGNYSRELEQLLAESNLTGKKALPLLFRNTSLTDEDRSIVDSILVSAFHEPIFAWELNAHSLPQELMLHQPDGTEQVFELEWHPIINRLGVVDRVLVTLRNVTEIRTLQASQQKDQQAFVLLLEIVQVPPDRFRDFLLQSRNILQQAQVESHMVETDFRLTRRKVLMRLHTWKGLSRSLGFRYLAARIHEVEHTISKLTHKDFGLLQEHVDSLVEKLQAYENIEKERLGRVDDRGRKDASSPETKALLNAWYRYHYQPLEAYRDAVFQALAVYMETLPHVTAGQLINSLRHELSGLAQHLQKPMPFLEGQGDLNRPLPEPLFKSLGYVLQHLIRNSMDHGLETSMEREAKGKNPAGRITVGFDVRDGYLSMEYRDDGRGLDLQHVLKKAETLGLVDPNSRLDPRNIAQFIFAPGFSTKAQADIISGRGIGMDAVRLLIEESGGDISLITDDETQQHQPFHLRARWSLGILMDQVA